MHKTVLTFLLMLTLCAISTTAQEVGAVIFQQDSDYQFSEDVLTYNVQTKKGSTYSVRTVNDDVKRLHGMGVFSDVVSEVKTRADGKKEVIFKITPRPVVDEIIFQGNKKYTTAKLKELVSIAPVTPLNDQALTDSAEALRKFYYEEGLTDAAISAKIERTNDTHSRIIFKIVENLRLRINNVKFEGNTVYTGDELRDAVATRYSFFSKPIFTQPPLSWLPVKGGGGLLNREELEKDRIRLREFYWRKGYLDFKVTETRIEELAEDPERIDITFKVEEGEPYKVGKVTIAGGQRFTAEELLPMLKLKPEMVYNVQLEDADLNTLEQKYSPLGYADFKRMAVRNPDYRTHTVDMEYRIQEGPLYRIRDIFISGNRWTKDHVIRRELPMLPLDPVDKNLLKVAKSRLMGMGYFENGADGSEGVDVTAINAPEPEMKDIDIKVKEKRFIDFKIGAGFSDTDSLAGMVELSHNNMDILDPWNYFTGGGQRMRLAALVGLEHMNFDLDFTEPWLFGIPLRLDVSGYWREVTFKDWDERRIGFSVGLTKRIFDDFTTLSGGYTFEQVSVRNMDEDMSEIFQEEEGSDLVGKLFLKLGRDTRNSATNPTSGYDVSVFGAINSQLLGGSENYYKVEFKGINYLPFFNNMFVLTTGFKVGSVGMIGGGDGNSVPIYDRYFLGGGDSVRGFPYRGIGPEDYNEDNYGGQSMYLFRAELSHPIYSIVRGAVFCDVGDAMEDSWGPLRAPNIGVGYGLRIKIPQVAVPIRLDLAYPILNQQDGVDSKVRFHFNMGFSF